MRLTCIKTIQKLAVKNKKIVFLTADLGFTVLEDFRQQFPDRFFNLGVAESNMISMAAGMALSGLIPITYSFGTFTSMRAFEFIRNDVCFQNANVKMITLGGGFGYGLAGYSHCNFEDLSLLRSLPNLTIYSPADPLETAVLTKKAIKHKGPVYLRLGKVGEPDLHSVKPVLKSGKGFIMQSGKKIAIFATGGILANVLKAKQILESKNIFPTIINIHTIKPLDHPLILKTAKTHSHVFSVEEHSITGGLGSAMAEVLAESSYPIKFKRLGIVNPYTKTVGNQQFSRHRSGLSPQKIASTIFKTTTS